MILTPILKQGSSFERSKQKHNPPNLHFQTHIWRNIKIAIFFPKIFSAYTRDCPGYMGILGGYGGGYPHPGGGGPPPYSLPSPGGNMHNMHNAILSVGCLTRQHQEGYNDGDYQGDKEYDIHRSSILSDIKYAMIRAIDTPTINSRRRRLVIGFYLLLKGGE